MAVATSPELKHLSKCKACDAPIAFVVVAGSAEKWVAVDVESKRLGQYVLLRDGVRAADSYESEERIRELESYDGPRFRDHMHTCATPSMMTTRAAIAQSLGFARNVITRERTSILTSDEQFREEQRARLKQYGRAPWVTRRNEPPAR